MFCRQYDVRVISFCYPVFDEPLCRHDLVSEGDSACVDIKDSCEVEKVTFVDGFAELFEYGHADIAHLFFGAVINGHMDESFFVFEGA